MKNNVRLSNRFLGICMLLMATTLALPALSAQDSNSHAPELNSLKFGGVNYLFRWAKDGQNEFTPAADENLNSWHDMVTINVLESVANSEQLAAAANSILGKYKSHGKVLRTDSKPGTPGHPAEYFMVAVLGKTELLEVAFARLVLVEGIGMVVVYSHRIYAQQAGPAMSDWLKSNGTEFEKTLMEWDRLPTPAALKMLAQAR